MIFKLLTNDIVTLERNGIHLISVDTDWMGTPMRLGDLSMTSCLLYCLKHQLIQEHDKFNRDNLFFVLNRVGGLLVNDIRLTLSLFPGIWKDVDVDIPRQYNVRNLLNGGNIWSFKVYLENNNIKLDDIMISNGVGVVDPKHFCITENVRSNIYLYPVRSKSYNIERNMDDNTLIRIIRDLNEPVTIITNDLKDNFSHVQRSSRTKVDIVNKAWIPMLLDIMSDCKLFISGDCGLSHFISMIVPKYKPRMNIYYNTEPYTMNKPFNHFDRKVSIINFKPYSPYATDRIRINKF